MMRGGRGDGQLQMALWGRGRRGENRKKNGRDKSNCEREVTNKGVSILNVRPLSLTNLWYHIVFRSV